MRGIAREPEVPLAEFTGPAGAWRVDVVLEALAHCRLKAGDRAGALRDFERLLQRLEKEPGRAQPLLLVHLEAASAGELRSELQARFNACWARLNPDGDEFDGAST